MKLDIIRRVIKEMKFKIDRGSFNTKLDIENYIAIVESLEKQIPKIVELKHSKGDEVALIICPTCNRSIAANLERYREFNESWYCKKCGQLLTLDCDTCEEGE